jgi:hypothetical protein
MNRKKSQIGKVQENNSIDTDELEFFRSIAELIQHARCSVEKQVNTAMVITYFEIGRRIVEKEQHGTKRAEYGKKVLQGLSDYLTVHLGKGYSVDNLKLMRRFYVVYSSIGETVFTQFNSNITMQNFNFIIYANDIRIAPEVL